MMTTATKSRKTSRRKSSRREAHDGDDGGDEADELLRLTQADLHGYFKANVEAKLIEQMPEDVLAHKTPATDLLKKKKELVEVEVALKKQQEEFGLRTEALAQRKIELERKERQLQENLMKFDRFLKENDARRERALRKVKEENNVTAQRKKEAAELREELQQYKNTTERQRAIIIRYQKFKDFLQEVLTRAGEFSEVIELVDRHTALVATGVDLRQRDRDMLAAIDEMKKSGMDFKERDRIYCLKCNNKLALLENERETARTKRLHWENQFNMVQTSASKRTLLLGQIKMATANLYSLAQSRHSGSDPLPSLEQQLEKLQNHILDIQDITAEHHHDRK